MRHIIPQSVKDAIRNKYAWPGGYPLFIVCNDGACLCTDCAKKEFNQIAHDTVKGWKTGWNAIGADINWEDTSLYCDNCGKQIESAYGEES
jgi:hypothetical protein